MRFHLSEEQAAIQDSVRGTLEDAWPMARLDAYAEGGADFDVTSWEAVMALGIGGLLVPETLGGTGLGLLEAALVAEVAGAVAAPGPIAQHMLAAAAIAWSGDEEARARLPRLIGGDTVATLAFGGGWTPNDWEATPEAGSVAYVPGASAASLFVLGAAGGGLALVEKGKGVTIEPVASSDPTRRLSKVTFTGANAIQLAAPGDPLAQRLYDAALVLTAADALGGAQHCLDRSVAYAKDRVQFGQPIGRFQAVKHQLAQMGLETEPARALLWYAAYAFDAALPDASHAAAIAKAHFGDLYVRSARAAVAVHGGLGYTWEYGLHFWLRRSLFDCAYLGGSMLHRARAADLAGW